MARKAAPNRAWNVSAALLSGWANNHEDRKIHNCVNEETIGHVFNPRRTPREWGLPTLASHANGQTRPPGYGYQDKDHRQPQRKDADVEGNKDRKASRGVLPGEGEEVHGRAQENPAHGI